MALSMTKYTVETLRAGQPKPYADSEYEYLVKVESSGWSKDGTMKPWLMCGNLDKIIPQQEADRKSGRMIGGPSPENQRKMQRDWALKLVKVLCHNFREVNDDDGRTGMEAAFYPTLERLTIDQAKAEIRALITEEYTD